jgi:hypothetical protein
MRAASSRLPATFPRWFDRGCRMGREADVGLWMGAAFCGQLVLAAAVLGVMGTDPKGTSMALHETGRLSFLLFWPAYVGGALATLFGPRFGGLARRGRDFGLAYAAAQLVHVGLVSRLILIEGRPFVEAIMPFFAVGIVWTYVLALSSVERLNHMFSPNFLRIIRSVGLEYLAFVFFADLVVLPIQVHAGHPIDYVPLSTLLILGTLLRAAAAVRHSGLGAKVPWFRASPN